MRRQWIALLLGMWGIAQELDSLPVYEVAPVEIKGQQLRIPSSSDGVGERLMKAGLVQLVYRSVPFAQEVVYQGLLPHQTQVTIDGMRILSACVDRMDPLLTFVEQAALEGAAWSSTQSWGATPTLNVSLLTPGAAAERYLTLQAANNYHRLMSALRLGGTKGHWQYAAALTTRLGGPYHSGRWLSFPQRDNPPAFGRDSVWNIPSFRKYNAYFALRYEIAENHSLQAQYLGDFFYDVAYPALIMDARHSAFHLPSLTYRWEDRLTMRFYANTIFHDMSDEGRPESEIRNRIVMPGMYMPMRGRTWSTGAIGELTYLRTPAWKLSQRSEYSYHAAWANMDMRLLDGGASVMRLRNLADVRFQQTTHRLTLQRRYPRGEMTTYLSGSFFAYEVGDTLEFAPLRLYQEQYAGGSAPHRRFLTYHLGMEGAYRISPALRISSTLSYGTRAPTHTELYAYYLYVPMDNSIQMGNSLLRPERLLRTEVRLTFQKTDWSIEGSAYLNAINDYITPVTFLRPYSAGNGTAQFWRILQNTGRAYTTGTQLTARYESQQLIIQLQTSYTYGWHVDRGEPLPWISPLNGRLQVGIPYRRHRLVGEFFASAAQMNLSRTIYVEDKTPAYWLLHLRYLYTLPISQKEGSGKLTFQVAVDNALNTYGWDHLSVGNMPFLGRVISVGVWYRW